MPLSYTPIFYLLKGYFSGLEGGDVELRLCVARDLMLLGKSWLLGA